MGGAKSTLLRNNGPRRGKTIPQCHPATKEKALELVSCQQQ
jgi:hypothetical protein